MSNSQRGFARKVWGIIRTLNNTEGYKDWLTSTGINVTTADRATKRMQTVFDIRSKYDWSGRQDQE